MNKKCDVCGDSQSVFACPNCDQNMCKNCLPYHTESKILLGTLGKKSLRDEFAMAALISYSNLEDLAHFNRKEISKCAYQLADAMMEARK